VRRVTIDPSVMDDKEMLEDLIAAAVNDAVRRAEDGLPGRWPVSPPASICPPGSRCPSDEHAVEPRRH
jgi:hypothetical protein